MEVQNKVYLTYETSETGGGYEDGESGPYSRKKDSNVSFRLTGAYRTEREYWQETVDIDFDPNESEGVYVVVVRYSTGDTFGRTNGAWYVEGAYATFEEADKIAQDICSDMYKGHKPWAGYFEHLESAGAFYLRFDSNSLYTPKT